MHLSDETIELASKINIVYSVLIPKGCVLRFALSLLAPDFLWPGKSNPYLTNVRQFNDFQNILFNDWKMIEYCSKLEQNRLQRKYWYLKNIVFRCIRYSYRRHYIFIYDNYKKIVLKWFTDTSAPSQVGLKPYRPLSRGHKSP